MTVNEQFKNLFEGNPEAHYTFDPQREPKNYDSVKRGISDEDIARHLRGVEPGLLSIPVLPSGLCHFACGDCDRHFEDDSAVDHTEVARKITEFGLPLVITKSKSPKSAHIWLFFKDKDGFPCATARQLIEKYMRVLGIAGEIEVFPKQEKLKEDPETHELQKGSGINLPYFGQTRIGFGKHGEELDLSQFVELALLRQSYGPILKIRDLADNPLVDEPGERTNKPLPLAFIRKKHEENLQDLRDSNTQGGWNDTLNDTAFWAGRAFAGNALEGTADEIRKAIENAAHAIDGWNERQMEATFDSGWESGVKQPLKILEECFPEAAATLKEFNEQFYIVENFGGKCRVCWETVDQTTGTLHVGAQSFHDFYNRFMHQKIIVGEIEETKGRKDEKKTVSKPDIKTKADYWTHAPERRQYREIVYAPGETLPPEIHNLWHGFSVEPVKGNCQLYLDHLHDNICKGDMAKFLWLTRSMAYKVRHPGEKGYIAPVLKGAEGVGKNRALDPFAHLWGAHALTVTRKEHLAGHFNNHLRACSVVIANEAFFAGDQQHESSLKGLITDDFFMIEAKGVDPVPARNRLSIMIMSNSDWVVPAGPEARRFSVFDCGDEHKEDAEYFNAMSLQLAGNNGSKAGYKALLHYLLFEVQLGDFDPRKAIKTAALAEQQSLSLRGVEALWYEFLYSGELPDGNPVASERILKWAALHRDKRWSAGISSEQLGLFLGMSPRGTFKGMGFQKTRKGGHKRWIIPALHDCRKLWDDRRFPVTWPELDAVQGEMGGKPEASGWDIVKVGDEPPERND